VRPAGLVVASISPRKRSRSRRASSRSPLRVSSHRRVADSLIIIVVCVMRRLATGESGSPNIADPSSGLVLRNAPCWRSRYTVVTTASSGRDGWIADLRQPRGERLGGADSHH
jgi:hypothetical protein